MKFKFPLPTPVFTLHDGGVDLQTTTGAKGESIEKYRIKRWLA